MISVWIFDEDENFTLTVKIPYGETVNIYEKLIKTETE